MQSFNVNLHFPECGLLGCALLTDHEPLVDALEAASEHMPNRVEYDEAKLNELFPGFLRAVVESMRALAERRLRANVFTYFNFRVQAWAIGYDADGTTPIRVIPAGMLTDPNGPVTFTSELALQLAKAKHGSCRGVLGQLPDIGPALRFECCDCHEVVSVSAMEASM